MPEDNQIQPGIPYEIQANHKTQQNNFIQEQQVQGDSQQVNQQSNIETTRQKLPQKSKPHLSWINKILGWLFILLGTTLTGLGIYGIFSAGYDGVMLSFLLAGVGLLIIGIRNISGTNFLFWIKNLFFSQKTHSSWLVKIVSCIFGLLGIALIGLGIYWIFETQSDWHYSDYTIRDIIMDSGIFILGPFGIFFIVIGILSYRTPNVDIYYHPTRLTKILSGIYRFLGIALVRAGLWNFSLIGTENLSFLKILYVGGVITLCGILYIFLGRLLYNAKSKIHIGFSMLYAFIINIMFARILREFTIKYTILLDEDSIGNILVLFTLFYFSILTIRWIIKCRKFKKKGIINPKYLDSTPSKKKVGIITTIVLFSLIIINLIYGKIQWSKIPKIDESIFTRKDHQVKLPDEEDALIQLKNNYSSGYTNDVWEALEILYFSENNLDFQIQNSGKRYQNRCIIVYSGNETSCGTLTWDKKTLNKFFNSYYTNYPYVSFSNKEKDYDYFIINGKKVTIFEYIDKNEPEINLDLQKLDKILQLDYNLNFPSPREDPYYLLPQILQGYTLGNMVMLQYYTLKKNWDMVMFIIKLEYKMVNLLNNYGSTTPHLISFYIQNTADSEVNSLIKLFPEDFRILLSERYSKLNYDKERMTRERIKGEYDIIWRSWAKDAIFSDIGSNKPSLMQFMFHFPFLSKIDTNHFMDYAYYNLMYDEDIDFDNYLIHSNLPKYSLYNYYGTYPYQALRPRLSTYDNKLSYTLFHKKALIDNLKSGKYKTWFNELEWSETPNLYSDNHIPTEKELIENKIKKYSDITSLCFGIALNPEYNPYYYTNFGNTCPQSLLELTNQDDDEFGLKEILINITQSYIDYNEISTKMEDCQSQNVCKNVFDESDKIIRELENNYTELEEILKKIKNKIPDINLDDYFYIPEMMMYDKGDEFGDLELDDVKLDGFESEDIELPESLSIIKEYSNIIGPCFGKDIIDPVPDIGVYHDEFERICLKTLKELKWQEKDDYGLKDILIEITKSLIDYSKFETNVDACWLKEGTLPQACEKIFDKEEELVYKIKENYKKLSHILENIENKNPGININKYFYIPYEKIFNDNTSIIVGFFIDEEKAKKILNDILLQESIDKIKNNEQKILSGNKGDEQLNYEKLVNLTNECMGEKILRSQVHLSYDEFINQCDYVIGELKNMANIGNLKQLTKNLIYITKEWIEFANIGMEEDLLLKKEGTDVGGGSPEWDALFNREDKNLENFKKYYPKLEEMMKAIKQDYKFTPEMDFYIPYSVINENTFRFTLHL